MTKNLNVKKFLIINGPNLNMLGKREPEIYGNLTLNDLKIYTEEQIKKFAVHYSIQLEWFQSNHEGSLIDKIHEACSQNYDGVIINPGALSHTSLALYDALMILKIPILEVHLTNTVKREESRQKKVTAKASTILMEGLGKNAYFMAIFSQLL